MSFYINNNNSCRPGGICGNPVTGLCEKALIQVTKVFDACKRQTTEIGLSLPLTNFDPAGPVLPLTYISASTTDVLPTVSNVVIDRISQRPNFANVSATITVPIIVSYRDANGVIGSAESSITLSESVVLFVPQPSATPIRVEAFASFITTTGNINMEGNEATVTGCLTVIIKITADVDILVPSYGYPVIPSCKMTQEQICPPENELPLFPTAITCNN